MNKYQYSIGRRKTSTATVRLFDQPGVSTINDKPINQVFPLEADQVKLMAPFKAADLVIANFSFTAKVRGGGVQSQLGAIRHGIARCLSKQDEGLHTSLKQAGLLTRDPRMVERKKTGRRKARKSEQYSKR